MSLVQIWYKRNKAKVNEVAAQSGASDVFQFDKRNLSICLHLLKIPDLKLANVMKFLNLKTNVLSVHRLD